MTKRLTTEEIEAFDGLEEAMSEEVIEREKNVPKCHLKIMRYMDGEGGETWWECDTCGHTKLIQGAWHEY